MARRQSLEDLRTPDEERLEGIYAGMGAPIRSQRPLLPGAPETMQRLDPTRAQDPSGPDTFEQRFRGGYPKEQGVPIWPGTPVPFNPYRLQVQGGAPTRTAQLGGGQVPTEAPPTPAYLPPGTKLNPRQGAGELTELPAGTRINARAPVERTPDDPEAEAQAGRERAARALAEQVRPSGGRRMGLPTDILEVPGKAVYNIGETIGRVTKEATTGEGIPILEKPGLAEEVFKETAGLTPSSVATRVGVGLAGISVPQAAREAKAATEAARLRAMPTPPQAAAETLGVEIPRAAEMGAMGQLVGRTLASVPLVGAPLRRGAERATAQLEHAGGAAAGLPTGGIRADVAEAGGAIRAGVQPAVEAVAARTAAEARMAKEAKAAEAKFAAETKAAEAKARAETKVVESRAIADAKAAEAAAIAEAKAASVATDVAPAGSMLRQGFTPKTPQPGFAVGRDLEAAYGGAQPRQMISPPTAPPMSPAPLPVKPVAPALPAPLVPPPGLGPAPRAVPPRLERLIGRSNEDIIGEVVRMAGSRAGADIETLVQLRRYVAPERYGEIQSAVIQRLGQGPQNAFDPATWLRNYGAMPDRSRNLLFGRQGGELRKHLDALESVSARAPKWEQFRRERTVLGSRVGFGGTSLAVYYAPLTALGTGVPLRLIAGGLAKPAAAASMARWAREYERVAQSPTPTAMAGFTRATANLSNTLGVRIDPKAVAPGAQPAPPAQ